VEVSHECTYYLVADIFSYTPISQQQTERFYSTPNQGFFKKKFKGKFRHCGDYFLRKWKKRKKCFLGYPNHQNFRNFKKNLQIFVLSSPRKQTILLSIFCS
jgi:hypothetical protein